MRLSAEQVETSKQKTGYFFGATEKACLSGPCMKNQRGFTLVELITVVVILGIISAVAAPRFFDRNTFDSRGFHDQVMSTLRYAQKAAIAQRRLVCVTFPSSSRIVVNTAANFTDVTCNTDLKSPSGTYPAGQTTYTIDAPSTSVTLSGYANFNFNALGRPSIVATQTITVNGGTPIYVETETGYVH